MTREIDPFTELTPSDQHRRMEEIANATHSSLSTQPVGKAPRTLEERVLLIGTVVVGLAVILVLAARLSAPHSDHNQSSKLPTPAPAVVATPAPASTAPATSTNPNVRADGGLDYLGLKAEAEEKLDSVLSDDHGVRYRDVYTKLSTLDGGGIVAFCGQENSRTPEGGYGGFQRFIASRSVAITEDKMTPDDFSQAWSQFCDGGVEGPKVWF